MSIEGKKIQAKFQHPISFISCCWLDHSEPPAGFWQPLRTLPKLGKITYFPWIGTNIFGNGEILLRKALSSIHWLRINIILCMYSIMNFLSKLRLLLKKKLRKNIKSLVSHLVAWLRLNIFVSSFQGFARVKACCVLGLGLGSPGHEI